MKQEEGQCVSQTSVGSVCKLVWPESIGRNKKRYKPSTQQSLNHFGQLRRDVDSSVMFGVTFGILLVQRVPPNETSKCLAKYLC